jgi:hypothetical protein
MIDTVALVRRHDIAGAPVHFYATVDVRGRRYFAEGLLDTIGGVVDADHLAHSLHKAREQAMLLAERVPGADPGDENDRR